MKCSRLATNSPCIGSTNIKERKPMPEITVYTRSTCAPCKMLKQWLDNKGVHYDERNVDMDPTLANEIIENTGFMMVPCTKVGNQYVSGLNIASISKLLMV